MRLVFHRIVRHLLISSFLLVSSIALADLPLSHLPQGIRDLAALPNETLEDLFRMGQAPDSLPTGRALGYHRVDYDKLSKAPFAHFVAVKTIWQAKSFKNDNGQMVMTDDTILLNSLEPLKAKVSIGSLSAILKDRYATDPQKISDEALDDKASMITDYFTWKYPPLLSGVMSQFKHWLDEYRVVDPASPGLLLGRSLYAGQFWGWLFIEFENIDSQDP